MRGFLLTVGFVLALATWGFLNITNLPDPVPPRWALEDQLTYRWYGFIDKLGFGFKLTPEQHALYIKYIKQGIDFGMDHAEYGKHPVSAAGAASVTLPG